MHDPNLELWVTHLRAVATPHASRPDAFGAGALDRPFAAAVLGEPAPAVPQSPIAGDVGLWWALVDEDMDAAALFDASAAGPLFPKEHFRAIEVWTEAELCGLHALWALARRREQDAWRRRADSARDWHLLHTQPDNATNRPWALHVFLLADAVEGRLYAETLLHNCLAQSGRPDPLSAWILLDAAAQLEAVRA
ncbi:MAG: hypothetical protein ACYTGG_06210 [Planctomycetota bacterium]|jgi:hypothetical protein